MLRKLSLSKKLFLSNFLFGLPVLALMYMLVGVKNKEIAFSTQEQKGDEYQRPLNRLLEDVSQHRLVAQRALNGDITSRAQIAEIDRKIDTGFIVLGNVDQKLGTVLEFTAEGLGKRKRDALQFEKVKAKWDGLKAKLSTLKASTSNDQHFSLIADIRGMIAHAGDTSNLILDPDLDSYYLMDVTLLALPQMQDRLQEIIGFVEPILRRRQMSDADRIQLSVYAALLRQSDMDRVTASTQTALLEDPNFSGISQSLQKNLPVALKELTPPVETVIENLKKLAATPRVTMEPEAFLASSQKALELSFKTWVTDVNEMDVLLQLRVDRIAGERFYNVLWGALALVFASICAIFIARNVKGGIRRIGIAAQQLKESVEATSRASGELVHTSQKLSAGSTEQSSAIAETAATLNEISAMVNKSLENANRTVEVVNKSQDRAIRGKSSVDQMIVAIGEINSSNEEIMQQVEDSNRQIGEIVAIISEIGQKTKVINDIVFQTKLLSFNASVEAARAGEHGKGFAVVAEEVGNLAQMSGNAAKEISDMLNQSMEKVKSIVDTTKSKVGSLVSLAKTKVEAGTQIAEQCGSALEDIVQSVSEVNTMSTEISKAQEEQARGVGEITKAMQQLEEITHQHAEISHQTSSYAEALSEQSNELRTVVNSIESEILGQQSQMIVANRLATEERKVVIPRALPKGSHSREKIAAVIPLTRNPQRTAATAPSEITKKAAGGMEGVPSENDPRFEDI